jgi:predicted nucleic acid-binding Zn ribbon protein
MRVARGLISHHLARKMRRASRQQRLRHRTIAEWRGVEDGPLINNEAVSLQAVVAQVLKEWKLDDRMKLDDVAKAWRGLVGTFIAQNTAPDSLKRGVLTVRVLQPAIHHTLAMQKVTLLQKLRSHFGDDAIKDVRFRHG